MAQKTPVSSLTINLSGTWTSLWYYEFNDLQSNWSSSLQLHYLLGAYFAFKRRLTHHVSIMQSNHIIYTNLQLFSVFSKKTKKFKNRFARAKSLSLKNTLKLQTENRLAILPAKYKKLLKKNKKLRFRGLLSNYFYRNLLKKPSLQKKRNSPFFTHHKKRLNTQKKCITKRFTFINNKASNLKYKRLKLLHKFKKRKILRWFRFIKLHKKTGISKYTKLLLNLKKLNNKNTLFWHTKMKTANTLFTHNTKRKKVSYLKLKKNKKLIKKYQNTFATKRTIRYTPFYYPLTNKRTRLSLLTKRKQWFSTAVFLNTNQYKTIYKVKNKKLQIKKNKKQILALPLNYLVSKTTPTLSQNLLRQWRKDWKKLWRVRPRLRRKHFSKKGILARLILLRSHNLRSCRRNKRRNRRLMKLSMFRQACHKLVGLPIRLNVRRYVCSAKTVAKFKYAVVFSRWRSKSYFVPTLLVVLISVLRSSSLLLMNWIIRLLKVSKSHSPILYLISEALKYFLLHPDTCRLYPDMRSGGARLEVVGKVDGSDRSKTFRFQAGAIPTSTLNAPLDSEYAACPTIYGVLGVHVWFFMKPIKPKLSISASFKNTNLNH